MEEPSKCFFVTDFCFSSPASRADAFEKDLSCLDGYFSWAVSAIENQRSENTELEVGMDCQEKNNLYTANLIF